jgi:hypothetical protein
MMMNIVVVASIYIEKKNERAREKKKKKKKKNEPPYITFSLLYSILSLPSLAFSSPSILHDRECASARARALALQTIVVDSYGGRSDDRMLCCRALMMMIVVGE